MVLKFYSADGAGNMPANATVGPKYAVYGPMAAHCPPGWVWYRDNTGHLAGYWERDNTGQFNVGSIAALPKAPNDYYSPDALVPLVSVATIVVDSQADGSITATQLLAAAAGLKNVIHSITVMAGYVVATPGTISGGGFASLSDLPAGKTFLGLGVGALYQGPVKQATANTAVSASAAAGTCLGSCRFVLSIRFHTEV